MAKYQVWGTAQMAVIAEVEAASEEDAIEIAGELEHSEWELTTNHPESPVEAEVAKKVED